MTGHPTTMPEALKALDEAVAEAARLRSELAVLRADRDNWRMRAGSANNL